MILSENALYLHGLKDAIAGSSSCGKIIYDYEKVVAIFVKQGMTEDEAIDYVDYNVMGVQCNGDGFIMMYDKNMIDIEDFEEYRYPEAEDGKPIKEEPLKDGYHDHGNDAFRYFIINRFPMRNQEMKRIQR